MSVISKITSRLASRREERLGRYIQLILKLSREGGEDDDDAIAEIEILMTMLDLAINDVDNDLTAAIELRPALVYASKKADAQRRLDEIDKAAREKALANGTHISQLGHVRPTLTAAFEQATLDLDRATRAEERVRGFRTSHIGSRRPLAMQLLVKAVEDEIRAEQREVEKTAGSAMVLRKAELSVA